MVVKATPRYQLCPKCGYAEEQGKRWDRVRQIYRYFWHNEHCPRCGSALVRECPQCGADIPDAASASCPRCAAAYPWAVSPPADPR